MTIVISLCYPRLAAKTYSVEARLCHSHLCAGLAMETFFTATSRDWPRLLQLSSSPHLRRSNPINWFFPRSALKFFSNLSFMPPLFSWASLVASLVTALPCTFGRPLLKNKNHFNFCHQHEISLSWRCTKTISDFQPTWLSHWPLLGRWLCRRPSPLSSDQEDSLSRQGLGFGPSQRCDNVWLDLNDDASTIILIV